jgi:hypothetical protein
MFFLAIMRRSGIGRMAGSACLSIGLLVAGSAHADDGAARDKWMFQMTPYLWLAGLNGTVGASANLPSTSIDANFGDIFGHLDAGFMALAEARRDRFVVLADVGYVSLSADSGSSNALLGSAHVNAKSFNSTIVGGYRAVAESGFKLDILGGVRVFSVQNTVDFSGAILSPQSAESSDTWVDPVMAVRAQAPLGAGFSLGAYGDVGGFGIDGDWTWQIYGGLGYAINDSLSAYAGYRYLDVHHEDGGFLYDVSQQGPLLGLGISF